MSRRKQIASIRSIQRQDEMNAAFREKQMPMSSWNDADFLGRLSRADSRRKDVAALEGVQAARPMRPPGHK